MPKFSNAPARVAGTVGSSPVQTTDERTTTHEGGGAFTRTAESDLFVLAATNMVGEDTFYESADVRDKRFRELVDLVTTANPAFIAGGTHEHPRGLVDYLRNELLMRSAAVVMACEYVRSGGANGRRVIDAACARPDEPAEVIGYWFSRYGRRLPMAVKRGVADAATRLYNERAVLRYDGQSRQIRMGDVVELVHPRPKDARQTALFRYLLDERHHGDGKAAEEVLPTIRADQVLRGVPESDRRTTLRNFPESIRSADWSWERMSGWLPGGMDAEAWSWAIPNMGAMALLRNLRNFDEAGISETAVDVVANKITDADEVRRSRIFPFHAWLAYREAPSDNWKRALGHTLELASQNVPDALHGSLVVIDCSGSMQSPLGGKSTLNRWEVAAVLGAALAHGTRDSNVVIFGETNRDVTPPAGSSTLRTVERVREAVARGEVGHSTNGHTAVARHWNPAKHRRVFIVTDDQMHDSAESGWSRGYSRAVDISHVPLVYTVNVGGYAPSSLESGANGRHTLAGFGDATFRLVPAIEAGRSARWEF